MPRFSVSSMLVGIAAAATLVALNTQQHKSTTAPYYSPLMGAVPHPPPYETKEMAISVHYDHGWPVWHTRESDHVMAHNAALYVDRDLLKIDGAQIVDEVVDFDVEFNNGGDVLPNVSPTNWARAVFDLAVALLVVVIAMFLSEWTLRKFERKRPTQVA